MKFHSHNVLLLKATFQKQDWSFSDSLQNWFKSFPHQYVCACVSVRTRMPMFLIYGCKVNKQICKIPKLVSEDMTLMVSSSLCIPLFLVNTSCKNKAHPCALQKRGENKPLIAVYIMPVKALIFNILMNIKRVQHFWLWQIADEILFIKRTANVYLNAIYCCIID